jgi:hypothetical protein
MSSTKNYVTADTLRATGIAMVIVASLFMAARCTARWYRVWRFQIEDLFIIPPLYRVTAFSDGIIPAYPTILSDSLIIIKVFFTDSMLLWFTLWSVKFSLLFLYRRLMVGLPKHRRWWWAVFAFCVVVSLIPKELAACLSANIDYGP